MARVFVGIPTINRPQFLKETVASVFSQTFQDFRILVSDDGSSQDAIRAINDWWPTLDSSRAQFHQQPRPSKEYGQGRYLFSQCQEAYFVILHDDDVLDPTYLETAVRVLDENPKISCFISGSRVMDESGEYSESQTRAYDLMHGRDRFLPGVIDILGPLLSSGYFPISGTVFRARDLLKSGFVDSDIDGNFPFELNLLLNLGAVGGQGYRDEQRLIWFRFHRNSLRNRLWFDRTIVANVISLLSRHRFSGSNERQRVKILGFAQRRLGAIAIGHGDHKSGRIAARQALRTNPLSYKNWLFLIPSHICPALVQRVVARKLPKAVAPSPVGLTPEVPIRKLAQETDRHPGDHD